MKRKKTLESVYFLGLFFFSVVFIGCGKSKESIVPSLPAFSSATSVNAITANSATSGGSIIHEGSAKVTERGVCWNTSPNPTQLNNKTSDGSGAGSYISLITGLSMGTTYYVRAYATSSIGTAFAVEAVFSTPAFLPTITTTSPVTSITSTSAISGGIITSDGGSAITARGVCWSLNLVPTIANSKTTDGTGTGTFTSTLKTLSPGTKYYARAYATNSVGTTYANEVSLTTIPNNDIVFNPNLTYETLSDIENNVYKSIQIGTQIWMAENLKTTKYKDGTTIPLITDNMSWATLTTPAYCWYNNDVTYKSTYGARYNWYAVSTGKLCPTGWHVPTDSEWGTLTNYLGGEFVAGAKLKETGVNHWNTPNTGATNESGFTSLPSGHRYDNGLFAGLKEFDSWWSASESSGYNAWYRFIYYDRTNSARNNGDKPDGFSVRCVKD